MKRAPFLMFVDAVNVAGGFFDLRSVGVDGWGTTISASDHMIPPDMVKHLLGRWAFVAENEVGRTHIVQWVPLPEPPE